MHRNKATKFIGKETNYAKLLGQVVIVRERVVRETNDPKRLQVKLRIHQRDTVVE